MTEEMVSGLAEFENGDYSEREKLALRFAERMAQNHHSLDAPDNCGNLGRRHVFHDIGTAAHAAMLHVLPQRFV